jgi:hypothetical protein
MKKIFLVFCLLFIWTTLVNADSDYENDYTLIDCVNWDNEDWVAFDSTKPYATLKEWIEKTIEYINTNVNIVWNEEIASWKTFNIKVKCSFEDLLNNRIDLAFRWTDFNNQLVIEGVENWFTIKNTKFRILEKAWNIVIKNAFFINDNMWYFEDQVFNSKRWRKNPISNWVTIYNSYFKLYNSINLWISNTYSYYKSRDLWTTYYWHITNYFNKIKIINSKIDIELDWDYSFKMPFYLKDSKINFVNKSSTWVYDVSFLESWNSSNLPRIDYSVFVSNEIDLWWNNLTIEDD